MRFPSLSNAMPLARPVPSRNSVVSPVPASRQVILDSFHDPKVANSPWVFTPPAYEHQAHFYQTWTKRSQVQLWNSVFEPIFEPDYVGGGLRALSNGRRLVVGLDRG